MIKLELVKPWACFSVAVISLIFWKLKSISQMPALQGKQRLKNASIQTKNYKNSSFRQDFVISKPPIMNFSPSSSFLEIMVDLRANS